MASDDLQELLCQELLDLLAQSPGPLAIQQQGAVAYSQTPIQTRTMRDPLPVTPEQRLDERREERYALAVRELVARGHAKLVDPLSPEVNPLITDAEKRARAHRAEPGNANFLTTELPSKLTHLLITDNGKRFHEDSLSDGPVPPNSFRWGRTEYRPIARGPFLALEAAWPNEGHCLHKDDLAGALGDIAETLGDFTMAGIRGELNKFFRKNIIPLHAVVKGRYLAIQDGAPRVAARKHQPRSKAKKRPRSR